MSFACEETKEEDGISNYRNASSNSFKGELRSDYRDNFQIPFVDFTLETSGRLPYQCRLNRS